MLLENHVLDELKESDPMAQTAKATSPIRLKHFRKSTVMSSRRSSDDAGTRLLKRVSNLNISRL